MKKMKSQAIRIDDSNIISHVIANIINLHLVHNWIMTKIHNTSTRNENSETATAPVDAIIAFIYVINNKVN